MQLLPAAGRWVHLRLSKSLPSRIAGLAPDLAPETVAAEVATAVSPEKWRPGPSQHVPPPPLEATVARQWRRVAKASAKEAPELVSDPPFAETKKLLPFPTGAGGLGPLQYARTNVEKHLWLGHGFAQHSPWST